jgi:tRNA dimethylallyltransferase
MRCVGYRQIWQALDAGETLSVEQLAHVKELGVAATRQLAKRQLTWLRSLQERTIIECDKDSGRALCADLFEILGIGQ